MPRRDAEDGYDDEDFLPRPQKPARGRLPVALWGVLGGVAIGAAVLVAVFAARQRVQLQARVEAERAETEIAEMVRAAKAAAAANDARPGWGKVVGSWYRHSQNGMVDNLYSFKFRPDGGVTRVRVDPGTNQPRREEGVVEAATEAGGTLALTVRFPTGVRSFKLLPDGILVLDDGKNGVAFIQVK